MCMSVDTVLLCYIDGKPSLPTTPTISTITGLGTMDAWDVQVRTCTTEDKKLVENKYYLQRAPVECMSHF